MRSTMPASSVKSLASVRWASASSRRLKTWGVCTAQRPSRRSVSVTRRFPSTDLIVSLTGTPATAAPVSAASTSPLETMSGVTKGRAPSWTTIHPWPESLSKPFPTESRRRWPPSHTSRTLLHAPSPTRRRPWATLHDESTRTI